MAKVLSNTITDKEYTAVAANLNEQLNLIKPLSNNTETRSNCNLLKSKCKLRQIPSCDYGEIIEEVVVIAAGDKLIEPNNNNKRKLTAMTCSIKNLARR